MNTGRPMDENLKEQRIGLCKKNKNGDLMTIIKYGGVRNISVIFENGQIVNNRLYKDFVEGSIKMPMTKTVFGYGIVDDKNLVWNNKNKQILKSYQHWTGMLERCFDKKLHKKHPTYIGCKIFDDWIYLSKFTEWFNENYYEIPNCQYRMELDKDILSRYYFNNIKIYSPNTATFVPRDLNLLLCKRDRYRGDLPIGVTVCNKGGYIARLNVDGVRRYLGYRQSPIDAFELYKNAKEEEVKRKANLYKKYLPEKVYVALMNYRVNISD